MKNRKQWATQNRGGDGTEDTRETKIGNNFACDNGISIQRHKNYNGSGGKAFGGASDWPALKIEIGFQAGQEAKRDALAEKIKALIDENA